MIVLGRDRVVCRVVDRVWSFFDTGKRVPKYMLAEPLLYRDR